MKNNIWIMNHYATNMFFNQGGRHYYFAKNLINRGYSPKIFCASTNHETYENLNIDNNLFIEKKIESIPFIFVKTSPYFKNNYKRIINIISFYKRLISVSYEYAKIHGKPDVIIASSVHPLTLKAGLKIAKKFDVPCITEVRDLWPESLVAYGVIDEKNPLTGLLYKDEKNIYKRSDSIIMTWEGGEQYLIDKGWDKSIDLKKVTHISNGIILKDFDDNAINYEYIDKDLADNNFTNIVYTGSIKKVNNLGLILDAAKIIAKKNFNIQFLIYGTGDEKTYLEERCRIEKIDNVIFKGRVEKKYIPSILQKSDMNLLHNSSTSLDKYGQSQNKLFEYLAAGKPIVQTYTTGFSVLERYGAGISCEKQRSENIANAIIKLSNNNSIMSEMGRNARKASVNFDFEKLTDKLINIIEKTKRWDD